MYLTTIEGMARLDNATHWQRVLVTASIEGGALTNNFSIGFHDVDRETVKDRLLSRLKEVINEHGWDADYSKNDLKILVQKTRVDASPIDIWLEIHCYDE